MTSTPTPSASTGMPDAITAPGSPAPKRTTGEWVALLRDYGIVLFLIVMVIALSLTTDTFFTVDNFKNLVDSSVAVGMIAAVGTLVIIGGGFDLSAGAIIAVAAVVSAKVSNDTTPLLGMAAGLASGTLLGLVNGVLCTVGRINAFVGTLGTSIAFTGLAVALAGGGTLLIEDEAFGNLSNTQLLGINLSSWFLIAALGVCAFLLNRTVFGRHLFSTGGNVSAARFAGVAVNRTLMLAYVLSGTVAALVGMIVAAQSLSVTQTSSGQTIVFTALSAILIGGNSVFGGEGAIWRTAVGVLILAVINNGFNLLGVDPLYQQAVNGVIILVAVGADAWARRAP